MFVCLLAPHLDSIIKAQRILCCKKLASDYCSSWKSILLHYLKPVGGKFVLSCNFDVKLLPIKLPTSYEECFKHFTECSVASHTKSDKLETADIARIVLWNNKFVCINGKTVYNNRLVNKGIIRIGDLIAENNKLITKCKLRELNVSPLDAFQLASVMDALPAAWRQSLKTCECTGTVPFNLHDQTQLFLNGKKVLLSKAESKIIYKELRNRVIIQPTAQRKYIAQFENDNLNWKKIYSLPFRVTLNTKSREF